MAFYTCTSCENNCKVETDLYFPSDCVMGHREAVWLTCTEGYIRDNVTTFELAPKNDKAEDKPQVSLLPMDLLVPMLEPAYREGVEKYERESWRKGFHISKMFDSTMRHLIAFYYNREFYDPDPLAMKYSKCHLGGSVFSIINMFNTIQNGKGVDDRP